MDFGDLIRIGVFIFILYLFTKSEKTIGITAFFIGFVFLLFIGWVLT